MPDPVNRNCFIQILTGGAVPLPTIGMREPLWASPAVVFCPGETYSFYINYVGGIAGLDLLDGSLGNYGAGASFSPVSGPLGVTHSVMNVSFPSGVPDGVYRMSLGGKQGNFVEVINSLSEANACSSIFEISHNATLGNFFYPYVSEGYFQKMRLRINLREYQPEINLESYRSTATGQVRNLQGTYQSGLTIEAPDYTIHDHRAMAVLSFHDIIKINGKQYVRKENGGYQTRPDGMLPTYPGEFSLYENDSTILFRA